MQAQDKKKAAKPKTPYKFQDDKGMVLEPEQYFALLQKKLRLVAKQAESAVPAQLLKQIKDVFEGEDKSRQGIPFSQLALSDINTTKQLYVSLTVLQNYEPLKYLYLQNITFDAEITKQLMQLIKQAPSYQIGGLHTVEITSCKIDPPLINDVIGTLPLSKLRTLTFQFVQLDNSNLQALANNVEKFVEQCRQKAQAAIDEAIAKHEEQLEKEAAAKKKKRRSKKKQDTTWQQTVDQKYMEYFTLTNVNMRYCGLQAFNAVELGKMVDRVSPYLQSLDLKGNSITAVGLGEIGAGLERAYLKLRDAPLPFPERAVQKTVYSGSKLMALRSLTLSCCGIAEDFHDAYARFGRGVQCCGNLQTLDLSGNLMGEYACTLNPNFAIQHQLTKVSFERDVVNFDENKALYTVMKEHQKKQLDCAKQVRKEVKAEKKQRLLEAKQKKQAQKAGAVEAPVNPDALLQKIQQEAVVQEEGARNTEMPSLAANEVAAQ